MTVAVVAGFLYAGYTVFLKSNEPSSTAVPELSVAKIAEETAVVGVEIDRTVRNLKDLEHAVASSKLIFDLPAFQNLQDFSVAIPEESLGRTNPFVPTAWKLKMKALEEVVSKPAPSSSSGASPSSAAPAPTVPQTPQSGI